MTLELAERPTHALLEAARSAAAVAALPYAGGLSPQDAWALVQAGDAVLVDVRTAEERKFVGLVPDSLHVAWATGTSLTRNPRFVRELEAKTGKDAVVLLLCRSGNRSALAAEPALRRYSMFGKVLKGSWTARNGAAPAMVGAFMGCRGFRTDSQIVHAALYGE
jgi:rhodanese-related sulfurtransferase